VWIRALTDISLWRTTINVSLASLASLTSLTFPRVSLLNAAGSAAVLHTHWSWWKEHH